VLVQLKQWCVPHGTLSLCLSALDIGPPSPGTWETTCPHFHGLSQNSWIRSWPTRSGRQAPTFAKRPFLCISSPASLSPASTSGFPSAKVSQWTDFALQGFMVPAAPPCFWYDSIMCLNSGLCSWLPGAVYDDSFKALNRSLLRTWSCSEAMTSC
jgi:hypothetical protein